MSWRWQDYKGLKFTCVVSEPQGLCSLSFSKLKRAPPIIVSQTFSFLVENLKYVMGPVPENKGIDLDKMLHRFCTVSPLTRFFPCVSCENLIAAKLPLAWKKSFFFLYSHYKCFLPSKCVPLLFSFSFIFWARFLLLAHQHSKSKLRRWPAGHFEAAQEWRRHLQPQRPLWKAVGQGQ